MKYTIPNTFGNSLLFYGLSLLKRQPYAEIILDEKIQRYCFNFSEPDALESELSRKFNLEVDLESYRDGATTTASKTSGREAEVPHIEK